MELMKPELERDPIWRTIPCAKEILVQKGIANRAPWENIQGGTEILESLGYTEYTGFALQFPRNIIPGLGQREDNGKYLKLKLSFQTCLLTTSVTSLWSSSWPQLK